MPGLLPGWTNKDIEQLPYFFLPVEMLNMLYILEARRREHQARTSTWMDQKGYRTTAFFFLGVEMLNVFYILEALRHN